MFTGIVEEIGSLQAVMRGRSSMVLTIAAREVLTDVRIGDSIAVNGVCLTVVRFDDHSVTMDVMPETYRQTNLGSLKPGDPVNLERAMAAGGRFGGHIVQGHVDTTGVIISRQPEENAVVFAVRPDKPDVMKYIVSRGSIAVDGISLTVVEAAERHFTVSIIPHTLSQTILHGKKPGDTVNLECDIVGKYVEKLLAFQEAESGRKSRITEQFLAENGFL